MSKKLIVTFLIPLLLTACFNKHEEQKSNCDTRCAASSMHDNCRKHSANWHTPTVSCNWQRPTALLWMHKRGSIWTL